MQPDVAEVYRLVIHIPAEEKPHVITGVGLVVLRLLRSNKDYIRILILYNINYPLIHNTDQLAPVFLLEPLHIAEPADRIPKRTDRNLDHHLFVPGVKIMSKERLFTSFFINFQPETDVELLYTGDERPGNGILTEQNHTGIDIGKDNTILLPVLRKKNADTVIEVKLNSINRFLGRNFRNFPENHLLLSRRPVFRRFRRSRQLVPLRHRYLRLPHINGNIIIHCRRKFEVILPHFYHTLP